MTSIFFYHSLKKEENIKRLGLSYDEKDASALVESYDEKTGHLILGNKVQIYGKYVTFFCDIGSLLEKIGSIASYVTLHKEKYELKKIKVKIKGETKEAYIIV